MEDDESGSFTLKIRSKSDEQEGTQKKTFTKWINAQLAKSESGQRIRDLFEDLRDGTKLLALLEILCGKKIKQERGRMRLHYLNNVSIALRTLEEYNVKLINISNDDIVDGNPKLTLALVWLIISRFQLQNPAMGTGENVEEKLLQWCKHSTAGYRGVEVRNFTTSWNNGLAFNALIHRYRPGLFDYNNIYGCDPITCCEHAFTVAHEHLGVEHLLDPEDVVQKRPDKKSILLYVASLFNTLVPQSPFGSIQESPDGRLTMRSDRQMTTTTSHTVQRTEYSQSVKRTYQSNYQTEVKHVKTASEQAEPVRFVTTTKTTMKESPVQHTASSSLLENLPPEEQTEPSETSSVRDSVSSFKELEDYNSSLHEVLGWLSDAERTLEGQKPIAKHVDHVKEQFHQHEDFMIELTSHQGKVGDVLGFGNQLISDAVVSEREEGEIREQLINLNDRWEALRIAAMDRQSKLHEQLMYLQQLQLDQLDAWLASAEKRVKGADVVGSDLETVRRQVEQHKVFQEDLEKQQLEVNSLTHMVVVVDDNAPDSASADLEDQLAVLGERWSAVCRWAEQRWTLLQDVLDSWQEYRDEERRLSGWLHQKESQVEELKHIDLGDLEDVKASLEQVSTIEREMEAEQATFGTFNTAAERVAENLEEDSPGVVNIQEKMEEFNERWNRITTDVSSRIELLKAIEGKLQAFSLDVEDKVQWMSDTETLLQSPDLTFDDENLTSEKMAQQNDLVESLDSARKQKKPAIAAVQRKGEELIEECRSHGNIPVTLEQMLSSFGDRWEAVGKLIEDRKHKAMLARQRREVQDLAAKVDAPVREGERLIAKFVADLPESEYELKAQLEQCNSKYDDLVSSEVHLIKANELSKKLPREDRHTQRIQSSVKKIDERWTVACKALEDRKKLLASALESGPPKHFVSNLDAMLAKIKNFESSLGKEFYYNDIPILEEELQKCKAIKGNLAEQQRAIDSISSTGEKFAKSLHRPKSEQLRAKLTEMNDKWREVNVLVEKRQSQLQKAINQSRQYTDELKGLFKWIKEANDFLKDQDPAAGDPETLEAQLDQSEALQSDINKLQRKVDSLNETSAFMIGKANASYVDELRDEVEQANSQWDELIRLEARVRDNLVAALEKFQKLSHDMKEMEHWILQTERSLAEDEMETDTGEITPEKMEHYKSLQQEISRRAPAVVRINTTASQLVKQTKQGSAVPLQDNIKKMNGDWARLKNKVTLRQHEFKQMQSELEQFDLAIKKHHKLVVDVERVVDKSATVLEASEPDVEEALRTLNRHVSAVRNSGPGSVPDLGNQLVAKNITVAYVTEQLSEYQSRADELLDKADKAKRALEGSLENRRQTKKDLETVRIWLVKIEVLINSKLSKRDELDEREIKSLEEEFTKHEDLMASLDESFRDPDYSRKNSISPKSIRELDQMRTKWKTLHGKFTEVKEQPMKKMESNFIEMHGELLSNLDKIQHGIKKLRLETADPRDLKNLLDRTLSYKSELVTLKSSAEDLKKTGHQMIGKSPEEKRAGVERRIDEVEHDYQELNKKVHKKEETFREGLGLAERLDEDMSGLETWLEETGAEVKSREEAGFPEDVDAEIKWNKGLVQEVTGRMSDVQQLTQVGRELVDLSETGQLPKLEDRLTRINHAWEELSSIAEQRLMTLPKYKAKLAEFERSVDQMNSWLEEMERETSSVRVGELDSAIDKLGELREGLKSKETQLQSIRKQSGEFVHKGRLIMEPYKRLVDRRWEDMSARVRELEEELERAKKKAAEAKNIPSRVETEVLVKRIKTVSKPGAVEEVIRSEERTETQSELPFDEQAFLQPELSSAQATPDETGDFKDRLDNVLSQLGDLEELMEDIETPRAKTVDPASDKIKLAEQQLDYLQPRVELLLKEGKVMANSEGRNGENIRESLLDLSGRWLKACDGVEKKKRAIQVVPHWYQFKSNLNEISGWILRVDEDRQVEDLTPGELQQQQSKFEIVFKDIEELNRQGIQVLSPGDLEKLRKRYRDIYTTFEQCGKPKKEAASYRVVIHTGDVKDAGTRAHVTLVLVGEKDRSPELHPEKSETYHTKFCRDQFDTFTFRNIPHLGGLRTLQVTHDNTGEKSAWFVKGIYVEDKLTRKVYFFDCNSWIGKDKGIEKEHFVCTGCTLPEEGEDIMTKHRLARVRWQLTLVEHEPVGSAQSAAWELVADVKRLSSELHEVQLMLVSPELQGADFDDISQQEDKLKLIGNKLESLAPKAENVFDRSESIDPNCSESELEAVRTAINRFRPEWNDLNHDFELRQKRWEQAMSLWKQFHYNLKDLTLWLNRVEKTLRDTKLPSGEIDIDRATKEQKGIEEGIARHKSTLTAVKESGQEIIGRSSSVDAELLTEKLKSLERRWELVTSEMADRKDRFQEEQMQIEEFMEETADLLLWMDDVDSTLQTKDPSPADEDALEELLDKIKDSKSEYEAKEDSKNNIQQSGERLLSRSVLTRPNMDTIRTRLDIVITRWEILRADFSTRIRGLESKMQRVCQFLTSLEGLSLWATETRELLDKSTTSSEEQLVDPKAIQESLKARQPALDAINTDMTKLRRESRAEGTQAPKHVEDKVKSLNEDWGGIASSTANLFAARVEKSKNTRKFEEPITVVEQVSVQHAALGDMLDWGAEEPERASPWPKFDKAVSELHEWLDTVEGMTKTEKIVLGDSDDMDGLLQKQKSVDDQLQGKQHLLDEIAEMGHSLAEDADKEEDKFLIDDKVSRLKEHWHGVAEKSSAWKGQIDFLMEEWRRYVGLREELLEWTRKAEVTVGREENLYGYTVSELEDQIEKHKEFEEEIEKWRSSIAAINQCGDSLVQEFSQYECTEMKHNLTEINERWNTIVNRSTTRRKRLQEVFDRMVRFHEDMINALTWLTSAESKVAELDSAVDTTSADEETGVNAIKAELTHLEEDINAHQEMFASLNENGNLVMADMESGDVLMAVQSKMDDMNDRWQSLSGRVLDVRDRMEETATEWRQLLMDLQEMVDWIERAEQELAAQRPIGGDLEVVQRQNEHHQALKGKLNVRRLVVDRTLESSKRLITEYEEDKTAEEGKGTSRTRIAQNLGRQIEAVNERWSRLCHASEEWQIRIDDVLRRLQILHGQMDDIDTRLTEAEQMRASWTPTQDLIIESLSDQLEELKNLQERVASLQGMFESMSHAEGDLRRAGVSLSSGLENRLDQLNRRWKQLQLQLLQRQHVLQEAYTDFDSPVLQRLQASVESPWERAVSLNKVPYYINHKTESTQWDHPKMTELYHQIAELNDIKYSAYRTAMKLRCLQKSTCLDMVTLKNVQSAFEQHNLSRAKHEELVGVTDIVNVLNTIYDKSAMPADYNSVNSAICIDLTLNWLLNVYDSGRVGKIRLLSLKVGLVALSRSHLEEKYTYLFRLVAGENGYMDHKQLGLLLHDTLQIPRQLGEIAAFGGSNIEPSVRSCFQKNRSKQTIESAHFLVWLSAEPQSIVWLPTLHRLAASEAVKHKAKCSICKEYPIVGFRFRCLKCFNYDLCQSCFWSGRVSHDHRLTHPMHQYCLSTTSGEDVQDFLSMVRNKFKKRRYKNKPPRKLGYLPIQTVMEGGNLETPPLPTAQQNVNNEVHNRLGMYAHRLAEAETNGGKFNPTDLDEEHMLIAQYCQSLKSETIDAPQSPTQIVMALDSVEKDNLENDLLKLEEENRELQEEYERLKALRDQDRLYPDGEVFPEGTPQNRDSELLAEAKLLRQHKGRLEARMQVLEDHNRQLEAQLQRLRQLLDQPNQDKLAASHSSDRTSPSSSISSLGADSPFVATRSPRLNKAGRGLDSDSESEPSGHEAHKNGSLGRDNDDPALKEVMSQINSSFPPDKRNGQDPVGNLFSTAQDVNKAVESLVQVMTDDEHS